MLHLSGPIHPSLEIDERLDVMGQSRDSWSDTLVMPGKPVITASQEDQIEMQFVCQSQDVSEALSVLTPEQHALLDLRFGLSSGTPHPEALIASDLALAPDQIEPLEADALRALMAPARRRKATGDVE